MCSKAPMPEVIEIKIILSYRGHPAEYRIVRDKTGNNIYLARLEEYKGPTDFLPPTRVTLTKGIRHWVGSCEDQELIIDLGSAIDLTLKPALESPGELSDQPSQ